MKTFFMKSFLVFAVLIFIFTMQSVDATKPVETRDGVFIHVSHGLDDPHRVLMAFQMANLMSEDKPVIMYFDISGVQVLMKESIDLKMGHFPSSKTQIKNLAEKGVSIYACPGCMKLLGLTSDDLMESVKIADKDAFLSFTSGRILSLDY